MLALQHPGGGAAIGGRMVRARRICQFTFNPGDSELLDGDLLAADGTAVGVRVTVRTCDDEHRNERTVTEKGEAEWVITVSPGTVTDIEGLNGDDGVPLVLTIAATKCPQDQPSGEDTGAPPLKDDKPDVEAPMVLNQGGLPPVFGRRPDVDAEIAAPAFLRQHEGELGAEY